ncbi:hypothetical protein DFJ73DRAFT_860264 [Zopfochytrium polystomum]|nr:hypothetical protein DFJ73DRAFT_860264 [Zopfochytrium polystomum]
MSANSRDSYSASMYCSRSATSWSMRSGSFWPPSISSTSKRTEWCSFSTRLSLTTSLAGSVVAEAVGRRSSPSAARAAVAAEYSSLESACASSSWCRNSSSVVAMSRSSGWRRPARSSCSGSCSSGVAQGSRTVSGCSTDGGGSLSGCELVPAESDDEGRASTGRAGSGPL